MAKVIIFFELFVAAFIAVSASPSYDSRLHRPIIIKPTYRPPPQGSPLIRTVRSAGDEPLWLYKGDDVFRAPTTADHPILPSAIDDVKLNLNRRYFSSFAGTSSPSERSSKFFDDPEKNVRFKRSFDSPSSKHTGGGNSRPSGRGNPGPSHPGYNRRNARDIDSYLDFDEDMDNMQKEELLDDETIFNRMTRSVDSPSTKRYGGNSRSGGGRNTGTTHPGYHRRNARDIRLPCDTFDPMLPHRVPSPVGPFVPLYPRPFSSCTFPIYARAKREAQGGFIRKPTHHTVIIPNWNPNARVNPRQRISVKTRF